MFHENGVVTTPRVSMSQGAANLSRMAGDGHVDRRVALAAAGQRGLLTHVQLDQMGVTKKMRLTRISSGRWAAVHPGVIRVEGYPADAGQALLAACLYTGGVASHRSAAWLWGLAGFDRPPPMPEVSVMGELRKRRGDGVRVHRSTKLHHEDRTCADGIPSTTIARTLCDLGRVVPPNAVEDARDDARRRKLVTLGVEDDRIGALARQGRRGPNVLRDIRDGEGPRSADVSWLERRVLRLLAAHGIPEPVRQLPVRRPGGRRADVDLSWPDRKVLVEVVGRRFHEGHRIEVADGRRANDLVSLGWHVLTVRYADLRADGGAEFVRTLRRTLQHPPIL
jgi:hypothetical protein